MTNKNKHKLWIEKYRPQNLTEYVFHDDTQRKAFERFVANKTIPHLLLSGVQGSGKTTIAQILINEMDVDSTDVMTLNASDENSVDVMRDKIKSFITTFAMGDFKIVLLDEADFISASGQGILRRLMEQYVDQARFILTCNYENKITPALRSRCQHYRFKAFDRNDIAERVATILIKEHIKVDLDKIDKYVSAGYPDIRKIINLLQQNTFDGVLQDPISQGEVGDYKFELLELIEKDKWFEIRKMLCSNVAAEEWEDVYRFLYENIEKAPKFSKREQWEAAIVIIADHLYKDGGVADREINAAAMFIRLGQI